MKEFGGGGEESRDLPATPFRHAHRKRDTFPLSFSRFPFADLP